MMIEELVQTIGYDIGMLYQVDEGLLLTAQLLVGEKGFRAAPADWIILPSPDLVGDSRVVVPVWTRPDVVGLDGLGSLVGGQGVVKAFGVGACAVVDHLMSAAEDVLSFGDGGTDISRADGDDPVDVQPFVHLPHIGDVQIEQQRLCGLIGGPVIHGHAVGLMPVQNCLPALAWVHRHIPSMPDIPASCVPIARWYADGTKIDWKID